MPDETEKMLPLADLLSSQIAFLDPSDSLMINADVWREAHGQHTRHRHLHALTSHRPGIVYGLEVLPMTKTEHQSSVLVAAGVAIDAYGRVLVHPKPLAVEIQPNRTQYVLLNFAAGVHEKPIKVSTRSDAPNLLKKETSLLAPGGDPPRGPYLELARMEWSGEDRLAEAAHPSESGADTIIVLYRQLAFPYCYADIAVKEINFTSQRTNRSDDSRVNRPGIWNLLNEGNGRGFHLGFIARNVTEDALRALPPALMYMAGRDGFLPQGQGNPVGGIDVEDIKRNLARGSMLFAEACGASADFERDFRRFAAEQLNARLEKLPANARLLRAHYLFPKEPAGGQMQGAIYADLSRGIVFSTYDYGAAWRGATPENSANPREHVRQALEFGLNIVAYAALRQRRYELSRHGAVPLSE